MAIKSYILTSDLKTPYVVATGRPDRPQDIRMKQFRKGEIIRGELKHSNNKPAFILVGENLVVPLEFAKELVTKEINHSSADGVVVNKDLVGDAPVKSKPKVGYVDGVLIGAVLGFGGMILAEKQGWIESEGNKNRLYAAIGGAIIGAYVVYRVKKKNSETKTIITQQ